MTPEGAGLIDARDRLRGYVEAVGAASLWGSSGIFAVALFQRGVPPESVALLRPLIGALILLGAVGLRNPSSLRIDTRGLLILMAGGGFTVGAFQIAYQSVSYTHLTLPTIYSV